MRQVLSAYICISVCIVLGLNLSNDNLDNPVDEATDILPTVASKGL